MFLQRTSLPTHGQEPKDDTIFMKVPYTGRSKRPYGGQCHYFATFPEVFLIGDGSREQCFFIWLINLVEVWATGLSKFRLSHLYHPRKSRHDRLPTPDGIKPIESLWKKRQQNEQNDLLLGQNSTVDSSVCFHAGAHKLIVRDEFMGLLYRLDHTDVVQTGNINEDSVATKAKSYPLE